MSIETMTKLATVTVGVGGSASIDFTNIPQTYTDLVVKISGRVVRSGAPTDIYKLSFNGSTSNQSNLRLEGNGSSVYSASSSTMYVYQASSTDATANTFGNGEFYISNYAGNTAKCVSSDGVSETNATVAYMGISANLWNDTSAITSLSLTADAGGNFVQYSTATLYGIRNARRVAGNSVKATGGNISFDGTYVIHTFNSSGTFTPTASLTADYLVVAGGGAGGSSTQSHGAGGGGAGGYRYFTSQQLAPTINYAVTIGAGGTGNNSTSGGNGSDSSFINTTSTGGGGGGRGEDAASNRQGNNGGSGGGSGSSNSSSIAGGIGNTPSTSPSQGSNGGASGTAQVGNGGSGGGSAAAGSTAPSVSTDTAGGAGTSNSISGFAVTYATGGGCNGTINTVFSNAKPNSGDGGHGAYNNSTNGSISAPNGGSGVVIIRYKA
jgi:hypothetical protein